MCRKSPELRSANVPAMNSLKELLRWAYPLLKKY
jgi:hypothetical protein